MKVVCNLQDRQVRLLVNFVRTVSKNGSLCYELSATSTPQLLDDGGRTIAQGRLSVGRCLGELCSPSDRGRQAVCLLGKDSTESAFVWQWCEFASDLQAGEGQARLLKQLDTWLTSRSFVATNAFSLADIWLYAAVYLIVAKGTVDTSKMIHLLRWLDQVQYTDGIAGQWPALPLYR